MVGYHQAMTQLGLAITFLITAILVIGFFRHRQRRLAFYDLVENAACGGRHRGPADCDARKKLWSLVKAELPQFVSLSMFPVRRLRVLCLMKEKAGRAEDNTADAAR